jgi:hydrogenase nickel incorporation protein HypB
VAEKTVKVMLRQNILSENQRKADELRQWFREHRVKAVNIIGSPGSGKTSILEQVIPRLGGMRTAVIEGDIATTRDAERIGVLGVPVVQITTHGACHLDAILVAETAARVDLAETDLLFIENIGNLVCPAAFDLGESLRILVLSTTEGSDKPAKYPMAFRTSQVVIVNKIDLIPYTDFKLEEVIEEIQAINPGALVFQVSCRTQEGIGELASWLTQLSAGDAFH